MNSSMQSRIVLFLVISMILFLIAQYIVNENPWQGLIRLLALIVLAGGELYVFIGYRRKKTKRERSNEVRLVVFRKQLMPDGVLN